MYTGNGNALSACNTLALFHDIQNVQTIYWGNGCPLLHGHFTITPN